MKILYNLIALIFSYPFDVTTSPNFEMAFVFISLGAFLSIYGIPSVDGSFIELSIHLAGQFKIVQTELKHLLVDEIGNFADVGVFQSQIYETIISLGVQDRNNDEKFTEDELDRVYTRLCKIAQKHIDAINICDKIVETYAFNIFMHFLTSALLVCMACINFTIVSIFE